MSALRDLDGREYATAAEWMLEVERRAHSADPERFTKSVSESIETITRESLYEITASSAEDPTLGPA